MSRSKIFLLALAATMAIGAALNDQAAAQTPGKSVLFSSKQGDINFPITPPNASGSVPGTLDNTVIGAGTPQPGTFTAVTGGATPMPISGKAAASGSNANGGDLNLSGGAKDGTGTAGVIRVQSIELRTQGAQATQDTAGTLTAAQILTGILTSNPSGAVNLQLPLATAMDTALPTAAAGDAFDFSVISIAGSTNLPTITTNTGWTLVGAMTFTATAGNAGRFRARKTGTGAWTLYRLS